ncbi:MAG: hypothetical protein ACFB50_09645 [Rubrobacteraceae bacterium]
MNFLNRLVMLVVALLMLVVPVVMLLVAFAVIPADLVNQYTNYQGALRALGNLSISDFSQQVRTIITIVSVVVALVALVLLLRELSFGRRLAREVIVEDTPGQQTVIKTSAVVSLVEGAANRAGAESSNVSLSSKDNTYNVHCKIQIPESGNFTETAVRTRENILEALNRYSVTHEKVEVTVQGTTS